MLNGDKKRVRFGSYELMLGDRTDWEIFEMYAMFQKQP